MVEARRTQIWLRIVGAVLALISLAALLAHVFNLLSMAFFLTFFGVPSILLLILLAAYAKKVDQGIFLRCLWIGLVGGFVGTCAYDLIRLGLNVSQLFDYNGFKAIHIFGSWISGKPVGSTEAAFAGWVYHFWNGLSFGVFYTLAFGRRHWLFGVGYGLFMEACMLGLFPIFLKVTDRFDFIMLSLIGHLFYGLGLGLIAQRYASNWSDASDKP